jgi:hypothetical protein
MAGVPDRLLGHVDYHPARVTPSRRDQVMPVSTRPISADGPVGRGPGPGAMAAVGLTSGATSNVCILEVPAICQQPHLA